jgi:hypothetical protein
MLANKELSIHKFKKFSHNWHRCALQTFTAVGCMIVGSKSSKDKMLTDALNGFTVA